MNKDAAIFYMIKTIGVSQYNVPFKINNRTFNIDDVDKTTIYITSNKYKYRLLLNKFNLKYISIGRNKTNLNVQELLYKTIFSIKIELIESLYKILYKNSIDKENTDVYDFIKSISYNFNYFKINNKISIIKHFNSTYIINFPIDDKTSLHLIIFPNKESYFFSINKDNSLIKFNKYSNKMKTFIINQILELILTNV